MIELSPNIAAAFPGLVGIVIFGVGYVVYRREKVKVDRQRRERGDTYGG